MKIVVINGQGGVGKDTFARACRLFNPVCNISMIDGVKEIADDIGWEGRKTLRDRKFLSDLKDLLEEYNDYPYSYVVAEIDKTIRARSGKKDELLFFVHAREPKDIKRWVEEYGAKTLLIRRPEVEGEYGNHADDGVFDIDYDYEIFNDGDLLYLVYKAKHFVNELMKEDD